jgi:hypothetical protein
MIVNTSKTKEIVFRRQNPRLHVDVMPLHVIEQVNEVKLLGVILSNNLRIDLLEDFILQTCSQRSCIIRRFRDQGLAIKQLTIVFDAIILSRFMYASQAWSGFLSQELIYRIDVFLRRMCKFRLCQHTHNFQYVANLRDATLFKEIVQHDQILPSSVG